MAAIIGGIMKAEPQKHLWQFLDGKLTVLYLTAKETHIFNIHLIPETLIKFYPK